MLRAITVLLALQLIGEVIARGLNLPLPGPVIGMLLLLIVFMVRGDVSPQLETSARTLTQNLSLLFVPAGVGTMKFLGLLQHEWLPIFASIAASVVFGIVATILTWQLLERRAPSASAKL